MSAWSVANNLPSAGVTHGSVRFQRETEPSIVTGNQNIHADNDAINPSFEPPRLTHLMNVFSAQRDPKLLGVNDSVHNGRDLQRSEAFASNADTAGGGAAAMTKGEIALVAILAFTILLVAMSAIYALLRRRRLQKELEMQEHQNEHDQNVSFLVIREMTDGGGGAMNDYSGHGSQRALRASINTGSSGHGSQRAGSFRGSINTGSSAHESQQGSARRGSASSQGSGIHSARRGSIGSVGSTGSGHNRRNSLGSQVSNEYKLAAMDRMKQIATNGSHI